MPTSVMNAVPPGSTRWSAVGTCVCVPTTRLARPSQKWPIACFSLVASQWMSTTIASAAPLSGQADELALGRRERIVERIHEDAAHQVDHQHARAVRRVEQHHAAPRRAGRIIERTDQPRRALDEDERLALVPRMIAAA